MKKTMLTISVALLLSGCTVLESLKWPNLTQTNTVQLLI